MSWAVCQNNPIDLNFYLQKSLESFEKKSADKIWSNKFNRIKVSCPVTDRIKICSKLNAKKTLFISNIENIFDLTFFILFIDELCWKLMWFCLIYVRFAKKMADSLTLIISLSLPECDEVELVLVAPPDLTRLLQQQQHNVSSKISPNRMPPAAAPIIIATLDSWVSFLPPGNPTYKKKREKKNYESLIGLIFTSS